MDVHTFPDVGMGLSFVASVDIHTTVADTLGKQALVGHNLDKVDIPVRVGLGRVDIPSMAASGMAELGMVYSDVHDSIVRIYEKYIIFFRIFHI